MIYFFFILFLFLFTFFFIWFIFAMEGIIRGILSVPFVPTPKKIINEIEKQVELKPNGVIYDLGAGDGRFLIAMKNKYPFIIAKGYELAWFPFLLAKFKIWKNGLKIQIERRNFFAADLRDADAIFCYLLPKTLAKLEEKFKKELKPGAKIISYNFKFPNLRPYNAINLSQNRKLYFYKI